MSNQELETQVKALLKEGKAVTAVRLVQEERQYGLKKAKDYVDELINNVKWQ